jgi:hypothetical protein
MPNDPKTDLAIAGGAIAIALFEALVKNNFIDRGHGLAVLATAQKRCASIEPSAARIIGDMYAKMSQSG